MHTRQTHSSDNVDTVFPNAACAVALISLAAHASRRDHLDSRPGYGLRFRGTDRPQLWGQLRSRN